MKKTISAAVGGFNFIFDEDAYQLLGRYLDKFKSELDQFGSQEVMDELEMRISELFRDGLHGKEVVDNKLVGAVIDQLGLPGGGSFDPSCESTRNASRAEEFLDEAYDVFEKTFKRPRRFMRDPDEKKLGGVCSGLSYYFDVDVTIIRLVFVAALICGTAGFWIYVLLWLIVPKAKTAADKCEMHGVEVNAENIRRFTSKGENYYRK